jgi:branched-chain amino acid transport system substrate-binding protein
MALLVLLTSMVLAVAASIVPAGAAGKKSPIVIGFVTSDTGLAASSYIHAEYGAEARIDAQNAAGGVDGHPLKLAVRDDESSFSNNLTVSQALVENQNAFAVIEDTSFTAGSYKYLNQQGVPVIGAAIDGPEWNTVPNSNMFSVTGVIGPFGTVYYGNTDVGKALKELGVTKLAGLAFNIPSAVASVQAEFVAGKKYGVSECLENTSVSFGQEDFGSIVLQMKNAGCNGVYCACLLSSDVALSTQLKQAGLADVKGIWAVAYDQSVLGTPSVLSSLSGTYTSVPVDTTLHPTAGTKVMLSRLKKYTPFTGEIPSLNIDYGYLSADLAIAGLQRAGATASRASFISKLRTYSGWTGGGVLPAPVIFKHFGTPAMIPLTACASYAKVTSTGFGAFNGGKPLCGTRFSFST